MRYHKLKGVHPYTGLEKRNHKMLFSLDQELEFLDNTEMLIFPTLKRSYAGIEKIAFFRSGS
jgi:hypothetical protein